MRLLLLLVLTASLARTASAQPSVPFPTEADVPELSELATVSLLTMLPGREVYSLFGHTALRISDPMLGMDRTYNYGTFDFSQPYFVLRFLRGHLDYQLAVTSFERTLAEYRFQDRPVIEQHLALEAEEKQALFRFLESNYLPQQREYRYDFLFDNCSTRPWDALVWATDGRLTLGAYAPPDGSFRDLLAPYVAADPGLWLGMELGLGRTVDRTPTPREGLFLPLELFDAAELARIGDRPLVTRTDTLFWVAEAGMPAPRFPWPTALAWGILALGVLLTALRSPAALRAFDLTLLFVTGLAGVILLLLWIATEHHVTRRNLDLLWLWPTHLVALVLLARNARPELLRPYFGLVAAASVLAAVLGLIGVLHAAVAPMALLVALRLGTRALRPTLIPA